MDVFSFSSSHLSFKYVYILSLTALTSKLLNQTDCHCISNVMKGITTSRFFFFFAFNSVRLKYGKTTHIKMMLRKNNNPPDNPNRAAFPYNPVSLGLNMQHQTSFKISKTFLRLLIYKKYKTLIHYEFTSLIIKPCIQSHANIKLTHYLLTVK